MNRKRIILLLVVSVIGVASASYFVIPAWRARTIARQEQNALARAEKFLKDGQPAEALRLVEVFAKPNASNSWARIEIAALTGSQNLPRLAQIYDKAPARILASEEASVLLARAFLHARKAADLARLRDQWRGREQRLDAWLVLDSDALLISGKPKEAEKLLKAKALQGEMEATRLTRLALLAANRDLPAAWKLLSQAASLQPRNSDIRSFRAQILETTGNLELARVEYVAALMATTNSPLLRDQLADFYLRAHNHDLAVDTWAEALTLPTLDFIWLKAHFWNRVLRPVKFPEAVPPPAGELGSLIQHIAGLKPGQFFDAKAFQQLPRAQTFAHERPEVFWLRLLDLLQSGQEAAALESLKFEPARLHAWDPDLAGALTRILCFRQNQSLNPAGFTFTSTLRETNRPPLFVLLEKAARQEQTSPQRRATFSPEDAALLRSKNIFSAAFLSAGWREAALALRPNPQLVAGEPDWLVSSFAQAFRINRSPRTALNFLGTGPLPPAADLVRAEILVEEGQRDEARVALQRLAKLDSSVGFRAAFLLALDAAEQPNFALARQQIAQQPRLANSDLGQELLARLALAENHPAEAEQIYRKIVKTSIEAKAWFARQAFAQKHWDEARTLTQELLQIMPDSAQLLENLLAIDQAAARP